MNGDHDERSIHATYLEKLIHISEVLDKHMAPGKTRVNWEGLTSEFIGQWYQQKANLKKAVTIIKVLNNKPQVI